MLKKQWTEIKWAWEYFWTRIFFGRDAAEGNWDAFSICKGDKIEVWRKVKK